MVNGVKEIRRKTKRSIKVNKMVLETIGAAGVIFKAKYVKRTGSPGKYKYWYRNPKTGKLQAGKQPAKKQGMSESTMRNTQQGGSVGGFIQRQKVDKLKKRLSSEQPAKKPSGSQGDDKAKKELQREIAKLETQKYAENNKLRDAYIEKVRALDKKGREIQKQKDQLEEKNNEDREAKFKEYNKKIDELRDKEAKRVLGLSKDYSYGFGKSDKKK